MNKRTDNDLLLARAWAMFTSAERSAFADLFTMSDGMDAEQALDHLTMLADEWIEELRTEKARIKK